MTCAYCQVEFDPAQARQACAACSFVGGGCRSVRCPRCHYEMPEPVEVPAWFKALLGRRGQRGVS